ncbi:hypothetical protein HanHA300_Chr01g0019591 [Helianthus annuus]|nr:hypothetical protein HanHA300_Chr01g0019591 [Helianthus annuus]
MLEQGVLHRLRARECCKRRPEERERSDKRRKEDKRRPEERDRRRDDSRRYARSDVAPALTLMTVKRLGFRSTSGFGERAGEDSGEQVDNNGVGELGDSEVGGGDGGGETAVNWQNARYKAEVLSHSLDEQLLAYVSCLRIATPVDQLPRINAQLAQSQHVVAKYSGVSVGKVVILTHYVLLLCSFKEQLQQHVRVHAMETVNAFWQIKQSLKSLTGTGATMSDDDDQVDRRR